MLAKSYSREIENVSSPFNREAFLDTLLSHLASSLEELIGLEESEGFISVVGQKMGEQMNNFYKSALQVEALSPEQLVGVLIDLKRRINGDFYLIEMDEEKIVLGNRRCPFAKNSGGHESLCTMTYSIVGTIVAQNLGYSRIVVEKSIARGDKECRVLIYLRYDKEKRCDGREYFQV